MSKCEGCIYLGVYDDRKFSFPICTRAYDLEDAIRAVENKKSCEDYYKKPTPSLEESLSLIAKAATETAKKINNLCKTVEEITKKTNNLCKTLEEKRDELK